MKQMAPVLLHGKVEQQLQNTFTLLQSKLLSPLRLAMYSKGGWDNIHWSRHLGGNDRGFCVPSHASGTGSVKLCLCSLFNDGNEENMSRRISPSTTLAQSITIVKKLGIAEASATRGMTVDHTKNLTVTESTEKLAEPLTEVENSNGSDTQGHP